MTTYTKKCLTELVARKYAEKTSQKLIDSQNPPYQIVNLVKEFINMISDELICKKVVYVKGWGKLVPKFKEGGRTVRNPRKSSGSEMPMKDRWTVTKSTAKNNEDTIKVLSSDLESWAESYARRHMPTYDSRTIAKCMISSFNGMIISLENHERIELRGLGVFYRKELAAKKARNPKTGESVFVESRYMDRFKVSGLLIRRLNTNE